MYSFQQEAFCNVLPSYPAASYSICNSTEQTVGSFRMDCIASSQQVKQPQLVSSCVYVPQYVVFIKLINNSKLLIIIQQICRLHNSFKPNRLAQQ